MVIAEVSVARRVGVCGVWISGVVGVEGLSRGWEEDWGVEKSSGNTSTEGECIKSNPSVAAVVAMNPSAKLSF